MVAALAGCYTVDPIIGTTSTARLYVISGQVVGIEFVATVGTDVMVATEQQVVAMSVDGGSGE
jgi:hypothetical protein